MCGPSPDTVKGAVKGTKLPAPSSWKNGPVAPAVSSLSVSVTVGFCPYQPPAVPGLTVAVVTGPGGVV